MAASTPIFLNNVASTISAVASGATTTVTVAAGDGAKFGAVAAGQYIPVVIVDPSTSPETVKEYMWVTGVAGDVLTVTRAAESASTYPAGALAAGLTVAAVASAAALAPVAAGVSVTTSGLLVVTHTNVQAALADLDAAAATALKINSAYGPGTLPTGAVAETMASKQINNSGLTISSGVLRAGLVHLPAGQVLTSLTFEGGGTALATGTHQWFVVLSTAGVVLAVTSDDTSTAWAANAAKTLTLTSPYTVPSSGGYYFGHSVSATTPNSFRGAAITARLASPQQCVSVAGTSTVPTVGSTLTLASNTSLDYGYAS